MVGSKQRFTGTQESCSAKLYSGMRAVHSAVGSAAELQDSRFVLASPLLLSVINSRTRHLVGKKSKTFCDASLAVKLVFG